MKNSGKEKPAFDRLFVAYLLVLAAVGVLTVGSIGITWDEPNYFTSSYSYFSWFGHAAQNPAEWWSSIDRFWEQSHEAPPFLKLWAGLFAGAGALVLGTENLAALGDAYRLGSYSLFLLAVWASFRFLRREFGPVAAWGAALSLPLMPPLFGFARLGQLDGAAAAMYLLAALALFRTLTVGGRGRVVLAGVLLGLAFATKLTVFPLAPAAVLWWLVYRRDGAALGRMLAAFGIGSGLFFAIWPWLWRDPVGRTLEFVTWAGGLETERLTFYLGEWWAGAPWHYPLVALVVFVPLVVAAAGMVGAVALLRDGRNPAAGWVLIHLALVVAVAGSGLVPVYGGPRQFLAVFPLWALCVGVGVARTYVWFSNRSARLRRPTVLLAVYAALALPGILWTGPANSLEYYGEAVGLAPGAHALGFETTYLADTYGHAVGYVNEVASEGATVYVQAGTYPVMETYRRVGDLRDDLRPAYLSPIAAETFTHDDEPREDSYFLFLPRQSIFTNQMLSLEEQEPIWEHTKGGVPLVRVYTGEQVAETLGVRGNPPVRDLGPVNALIAGGGVLVLLLLLWRQQKQHEQRQQE